MKLVQSVASDDLRVVLCLAFNHRAPPLDVAAFKAALWNCPLVVSSCDLTGTFDFMLEATVPDMDSYSDKLDGIREPLGKLVSRYEANFVSKRVVRTPHGDAERALWVPCEEGVKRIDLSLINRVSAEGDYMRVHTEGTSWMVHMTMNDMVDHLGNDDFILVHRSTILRCGFIERLRHRGRVWTAILDDGSVERIAKSRVADVLAKLRTNSSTSVAASANKAHAAEPAAVSQRKIAAASMQS